MSKVIDLRGKKFGKLRVLYLLPRRSKDRHARWVCKCRCSKLKNFQGSTLQSGAVKSCGCHNSEVTSKRNFKHGYSRRGKVSPEYRAYTSAKDRCRKDAKAHERYFDRGIRFKFSSFTQFFKEIGNRPSSVHSLDRENNNGHYEPGNVRWATRSQQQKNKGNKYKEKILVLEKEIKRLERKLAKCSR